jgi:hypothetical protein
MGHIKGRVERAPAGSGGSLPDDVFVVELFEEGHLPNGGGGDTLFLLLQSDLFEGHHHASILVPGFVDHPVSALSYLVDPLVLSGREAGEGWVGGKGVGRQRDGDSTSPGRNISLRRWQRQSSQKKQALFLMNSVLTLSMAIGFPASSGKEMLFLALMFF